MRKIILLALLMAAFVAMPAFASVQNVKVSGDIDSTYVYRKNFDLGANGIGDEVANFPITQTRLRVDSDLTDNVSATVALINERGWNNADTAAGDSSDIVINLAYATLREMLYSPLTVVVGRQAFHYGNSFIIDSAGTNNSAAGDSGISPAAGDLTKGTAQDAVRLIFDYNPLTVEFLVSKLQSASGPSGSNVHNNDDYDDIDLYGINTSYELGDGWNSLVEAYFFFKSDRSVTDPDAGVEQETDKIYVPGLRASTNPIEGLNVQAEVAWQGGNKVVTTTRATGSIRRNAYGVQAIANYQLPVLKEYKPTAQYVFTFVSGDHNVSDLSYSGQLSIEKYNAWDPMFENQASGKIYNAIFNLTNLQIHTAEFSVNPIEDLTTKFTWTGMWLDKKSDATTWTLISPDGTRTADVSKDETALGYELDFDTNYDYTEDVQIGASLGWFFPGDVFDHATPVGGRNKADNIAKQALVHVNVNF